MEQTMGLAEGYRQITDSEHGFHTSIETFGFLQKSSSASPPTAVGLHA